MKDERFYAIVVAFREENTGATLDAQRIRRRILASLARPQRRNLQFAWGLLPMVAILIASIAMAAPRGSLRMLHALPWWKDETSAATKATDGSASARLGKRPKEPGRAEPTFENASVTRTNLSSGSVDMSVPSQVPVFSLSVPLPRPMGHPRARVEAIEPARDFEKDFVTPAPSAVSTPGGADELALYRAAHTLHFEGSDPSQAAVAWERYLRAFPNGTLAVEARFNLALCWIKTGRVVEARHLLEEFAAGSFDSYRRTDASTLLRLLRRQNREDLSDGGRPPWRPVGDGQPTIGRDRRR